MSRDEYIRDYLSIDEESPSGLVWKISPARNIKAGTAALTTLGENGYLYGNVMKKRMYTHRVVFFLAYGYWPKEVDHIDRNRRNNIPSNLREGDRKINMQNRSVKGWDLHKASGKWRARISVNGKVKSLGYFFTEEEAKAVYLAAKIEYHEHYTEVL